MLSFLIIDYHNHINRWEFLARFEHKSDAMFFARNVARVREQRASNTTIYVVNLINNEVLATLGKRGMLNNVEMETMIYGNSYSA